MSPIQNRNPGHPAGEMPAPEGVAGPVGGLRLMASSSCDPYGIECGILGPLGLTGQSEFNLDFAGAIASAVNDWQRESFSKPEPRLKWAVTVPVRRCGGGGARVQSKACR